MSIHGFRIPEYPSPLRGGGGVDLHKDVCARAEGEPLQRTTKGSGQQTISATDPEGIRAIKKHARRGRDFALGTVMESIRKFDYEHPIASKALAFSTIISLSAGIGVAIDQLADYLAHVTERKNDKVGKIMGTICGVLIAIQGTITLAGGPKRLEMWSRARDFAADSKSPPGQARQFIEERCLPIYMAMVRNAKALNGVGHEQLVINNADVFDSLNYINANNIPKSIWKTYLIEMTEKPKTKMPYFRATTTVEHLGIKKDNYYVSKYYSTNHLLQRDWVNSFDYNSDRIKPILEKMTNSFASPNLQGKTLATIEAELEAAETKLNEAKKSLEDQKALPKSDVPTKDGKTVLLSQIEDAEKAVRALQLQKSSAQARDVIDTEEKIKNASGSQLTQLQKDLEKHTKNLTISLGQVLRFGEKGSEHFDNWINGSAGQAVLRKVVDYTRNTLSDSVNGVKNGVTNVDRFQVEQDELYGTLVHAIRNSYGDEDFKNRTWVRVDELTKLSYILAGIQEPGLYNMIRLYNNAFHEALSGSTDPSTQARNAGTSITMYFPMVILGSIVTVLLAGISATPTAPPPRVTESGHAMTKAGANGAAASTLPQSTVAGGPNPNMNVGGAMPSGNSLIGHESPVAMHHAHQHGSQSQASQQGGAAPAYQSMPAAQWPPAGTAAANSGSNPLLVQVTA